MHLTCTGSGPRTAVLIAGFTSVGEVMWGDVVPQVAPEARVCTYDRFGMGTSDAPPRRQTFTTQADDLHELLVAAGEPGPYVVAGHSFGGDVAVAFASRFADEVEGLLLVDTSPVEWPAAACAVPDDGSDTAGSFQDTCAMLSNPRGNPERLDAVPAFAEMGEVTSLGDLPMTVLTRADLVYPGLAAASQRELARVWNDGQAHWASLSSSSQVVPVEDTSHYIPNDRPAVVAGHLLDLLPRG
jgi:pimeloyl-ACP methyl ester carboxylesterase